MPRGGCQVAGGAGYPFSTSVQTGKWSESCSSKDRRSVQSRSLRTGAGATWPDGTWHVTSAKLLHSPSSSLVVSWCWNNWNMLCSCTGSAFGFLENSFFTFRRLSDRLLQVGPEGIEKHNTSQSTEQAAAGLMPLTFHSDNPWLDCKVEPNNPGKVDQVVAKTCMFSATQDRTKSPIERVDTVELTVRVCVAGTIRASSVRNAQRG